MSTEQALVIRDTEGTYYVSPPAVLEANRVPAEQQALQAAAAEEVSGYIAYLTGPGGMPSYSYGYSYSYGPDGYSYSYGYAYTLPGMPAPGPRVTPTPGITGVGPVVPN